MNNEIHTGQPVKDMDGNIIQAHGAGMFYENGVYYWYGENKEFTTGKNEVWTWGIRFYSSSDLVNWKSEGIIIEAEPENQESSLHPSKHVDRPHILYNKKNQKYVCWLKLSEERGYFTILTADHILGPYRMEKDHFQPFDASAGDFDLWQDNDGTGYLFFEHDHAGVITTALTDDFLDVNGEHFDLFTNLYPPYTREGITHFTYREKHYLLSSGMTGYIPNPSEIAVSDSPLGPYKTLGNPHVDDASGASFNSQISFVFQHPDHPEFYLVMADRWVPEFVMTKKLYGQIERVVASQSDPRIQPLEEDYVAVMDAPFLAKANTSIATYVWLPLEFCREYPAIHWRDVWSPADYL